MAGRGPAPKNPATRQRRNRVATAVLEPGGGRKRAPALPARGKGEKSWHALVRAWWKDVWASPMAAKFLQADLHGLYLLAELRDRFWRGATELAGEIRLQEQRFGLTPLDRWRLQWEIHDGPKPVPAEPLPPEPAPAPAVDDPRKVLEMVRRRA